MYCKCYGTIVYDASGNQLWAKQYSGPAGSDWAYALALDDSGNVCVTGESVGDGPYVNYRTIKYDSLGNEVWLLKYHGPAVGWSGGRDVALDDSGNVHVTGFSEGSSTGYDFVTIKYTEDLGVGSFSLMSPENGGFVRPDATFRWQDAVTGDSGDQVRYDLYLSTTFTFHHHSTVVYDSLLTNSYDAALDFGTYYWKVKAYDDCTEIWSTEIWMFHVLLFGDANGDGIVDPADVVYIINYLFRGGNPPDPLPAGDASCDGVVGPMDVAYLINYLFRNGDPPGCD